MRNELPRRLGLLSAIAVLVGSTIGSGIFRTPAIIADRLPGPVPLLSVWVTGGLLALCGALTLAEVAGAYPRTGGLYVFIREGWGRLPAFLFGWSELTVIRASALGAIATIFAEYLGYFVHLDAGQVRWVAAVAILAMGALNYLGVSSAARVMNLTTIAMGRIRCGLPKPTAMVARKPR